MSQKSFQIDAFECNFYVLLSCNLENLKYFFRSKILCLDGRKKQIWKPVITQMGKCIKKVAVKRGKICLKPGDFR